MRLNDAAMAAVLVLAVPAVVGAALAGLAVGLVARVIHAVLGRR